MRFDNSRESDNIEDRRGDGGGGGLPIGGRGIGLGTVVLALVAMYFGVDPRVVLNLAEQAPAPSAPAQHRAGPPANDPETVFVRHVLAETEDTWQTLFRQNGREYVDPKLVLFSGATRTACGTGQTAMGPFYCPADQKVYIDLAFYQELKSRFHAPGEFAQAYVIAHEVGHHVQNLLGQGIPGFEVYACTAVAELSHGAAIREAPAEGKPPSRGMCESFSRNARRPRHALDKTFSIPKNRSPN